jgi:hypothetical protein
MDAYSLWKNAGRSPHAASRSVQTRAPAAILHTLPRFGAGRAAEV